MKNEEIDDERLEGYEKYTEANNLIEKTIRVIKNHGIFALPKYIFEYLKHNLESLTPIVYEGKKYKLYRKWFNPLSPWRGEREAELPIFKDLIDEHSGKKMLEVGNVIKNYYSISGLDVVDKYDKGRGVINEDIIDFKPKGKYDLIISISTIEHIGYDEMPRENKKAETAVKYLIKLLKNEGLLIFSIPWNHNPYLVDAIKKGRIKYNKIKYFSRNGKKWFVGDEEPKSRVNFALVYIKKAN